MKDHLSVYKTLAFIPTACCGDESHKMPFTKINKYYMLYTNYIVLDLFYNC